MRLLPHKRTKNDQVMLFYVTAADAALSNITGQNTIRTDNCTTF